MKIDYSLITLIPADESYREFSYQVKKDAEGDYITQIWGWDEDVQRDFHTRAWREDRPEIILYNREPIGTICVIETEECYRIKQFFIASQYQNRGIGSYLLKDILDKADRTGRVTRLTFLKNNPVASLYKRNGFKITGSDEHFNHMERAPVKRTYKDKNMKYQAVIFDLFGTLVDNLRHSENKAMLVEMASVLGLLPEEFLRAWLDTSGSDRFTGVFTDLKHTLKVLAGGLNPDVTDAQIERAVHLRYDYTKRAIIPRPGTTEVLEKLKSTGYRLGLITDCSPETVAIWQSTALAPFFHATVFSCSVGMTKPHPRIYQIAAERLGTTPEECLYIGDGGSRELTGALQAGMHPVLIRDRSEDTSEVYFEREEWAGPTITSLKEIPDLLE